METSYNSKVVYHFRQSLSRTHKVFYNLSLLVQNDIKYQTTKGLKRMTGRKLNPNVTKTVEKFRVHTKQAQTAHSHSSNSILADSDWWVQRENRDVTN